MMAQEFAIDCSTSASVSDENLICSTAGAIVKPSELWYEFDQYSNNVCFLKIDQNPMAVIHLTFNR
jgi:hypothetical protein